MAFVQEVDMKRSLLDQLKDVGTSASEFENDLRSLPNTVCSVFREGEALQSVSFEPLATPFQMVNKKVSTLFPYLCNQSNRLLRAVPRKALVKNKRVAVLFSGGPASGGHNVLVGIKKALGKDNVLLGVKSGPKGLLNGQLAEISDTDIERITNLGGFDFLGSDRTKIKSESQFSQVRETVKKFQLDALIIIGGDDSNTNAAFLAEYLREEGCSVVGVPKTIDGDLKVAEFLPISFGFDTATKIYAELVGNILQDASSSQKYWHFVKLMGRSASHVALEVALQTRPSVTLISEEVSENKNSLLDIIGYLSEVIAHRAGKGINHGVVLIPEGLIEQIPEFSTLINDLNEALATYRSELAAIPLLKREAFIVSKLSRVSAQLLVSLPDKIKDKLLLDRDSHGNLQVSQIPTELLLIEMVSEQLSGMKRATDYTFQNQEFQISVNEWKRFQSFKFSANNHFFGYEGRCGAPTRFDADYTYNLGLVAGSLVLDGMTGYMAAVGAFEQGGQPYGIPLVSLLHEEGKETLVIKKALVDLDSPAFKAFIDCRTDWAQEDCYYSPGPRQMRGPTASQLPLTVALDNELETLDFSFE